MQKDLYVCKNKDCSVHLFYGDKGYFSLECPHCRHDDVKNGNNTNRKE